MHPTDIADTLDRFQWEALRALCAPRLDGGASPDRSGLSATAVERLLETELLEWRDARPAPTEKGRKVMVCGSPRLWNS